MKLIACHVCHRQYDVETTTLDRIDCRCGEELEVARLEGQDAVVQRCGACGALAKEDESNCSYCGSDIVHLGREGSLICPECYARNGDDARFCLACGVAFAPESIIADASGLDCPSCGIAMLSRSVAGIAIDECGKCNGLWAPMARFDELIERAAQAARDRVRAGEDPVPRVDGGNPAQNRVEYRRCPECDDLMGRRNYQKRSGVIIDRCVPHGTWLDAHELERIAGFVLSGRAERVARSQAEERAEDERAEARAAFLRAKLPDGDSSASFSSFSSFGNRGDRSAVETVFELLTTLIR